MTSQDFIDSANQLFDELEQGEHALTLLDALDILEQAATDLAEQINRLRQAIEGEDNASGETD